MKANGVRSGIYAITLEALQLRNTWKYWAPLLPIQQRGKHFLFPLSVFRKSSCTLRTYLSPSPFHLFPSYWWFYTIFTYKKDGVEGERIWWRNILNKKAIYILETKCRSAVMTNNFACAHSVLTSFTHQHSLSTTVKYKTEIQVCRHTLLPSLPPSLHGHWSIPYTRVL